MEGTNAAVRALEQTGDVVNLPARLRSVHDELGDITATPAPAATDTEANPTRFAEIYVRHQGLSGLWRELGMRSDGTIGAVGEARAALANLEDPESTRKRLEEECEYVRKNMKAAGEALYEARSQAAGRLGTLVDDELTELALASAWFEIAATEGQPVAHGADVVEFLLASHSGAPLRPIDASVSSGEFSRVMSVVEVSPAERAVQSDHAFLFNEVDTGISGRTAQAAGKRLAKLVEKHQVIATTHLTQVTVHTAIQAAAVKEEDESGVRTNVTIVTDNERLGELARMLLGNDIEVARTHAAELLGDGPDMVR